LPITALTREFIGCIVEITPVVSVAKTLTPVQINKAKIEKNLIIRGPLKFLLKCYNITLYLAMNVKFNVVWLIMKFNLKNTKEVQDSIAKVFEICELNSLVFTEIRQKIFEIIIKYKKPIKAYEILDVFTEVTGKRAHPPTIYRAIDFLIENGFIHKLNSINSYVGCFHPKVHKECYFLICKICNIYQECCDKNLTDNIFKTANKRDFIVSNTTLEIEGHCHGCIQK